MFQIPVQNLDKIRKARKKVKGILVDIGRDSCRELLQAINSYDPGEKYFYSTSWSDMSLWDSSGRKMAVTDYREQICTGNMLDCNVKID